MRVFIFDKLSSKLVGSYQVNCDDVDPGEILERELIDQAWTQAVLDNAVDADNRSAYTFQLVD